MMGRKVMFIEGKVIVMKISYTDKIGVHLVEIDRVEVILCYSTFVCSACMSGDLKRL